MASGFSHTTWPAGGEDLADLRMVEVVRRGDVNDLDPAVIEEVGEGRIGLRHADALGAAAAALWGRSEQSVHLHAQASQGLDVDGADEAAADDGGPDLARASHPWPAASGWLDGW